MIDSREIQPIDKPVQATICVPGSKSITNRALLLAALAEGNSTIENALVSEDSQHFVECLRQLGFAVQQIDHDPATATFIVHGRGGHIPAREADLFVGNSGTTARFLTAAVCLGIGTYRIDGIPRMRERPIAPLVEALRQLGVQIDTDGERFPLTIHAAGLRGGTATLDAGDSSQFLSALLMASPCAELPVTIERTGALVSEPYIDTTLRMMTQFGLNVAREGERCFHVPVGRYRAQTYTVEPDASNASYFFAAAAVTAGVVTVPYLTRDSLQGDVHFLDVLERMGCVVEYKADGVTVRGPEHLRGVDADMNAISDTAQTLAAIAPYADGPVAIRNIAHVRHKETDRIAALVTELRRLGVAVDEFPDGLTITPGPLHAGTVETYNDHRMAMAFSVTGLRTAGIVIANPSCTQKTFPDFFERFAALYHAPYSNFENGLYRPMN
ncbi:MAG: 3-phosphoshikimate 1-carboxyvinyltransferase [Aggregatilineales bacterium]